MLPFVMYEFEAFVLPLLAADSISSTLITFHYISALVCGELQLRYLNIPKIR